jgi:DNA repair protein RadC
VEYALGGEPARVRDLPAPLRPREEMDRVGAAHMSDAGLLAILLRSGSRGMNVVELSTRLLTKYRSLAGLATTSIGELAADKEIKGLGPVKAQVLMAALEIGRRLQREFEPLPDRVRSPDDVVRLLREQARLLEREVFWVLHLDAKNRLKGGPAVVSEGILDASLVHPREVFRDAVRTSTAAVVVAHNHPSGDPTPSAEDVRITRQLVDAGRIMDIRVMDHIVLGRPRVDGGAEYVSMRESGLVQFAGD